MKRFQCSCGGPIFFDNHQCLQCGAQVGFEPESMSMVPVEQHVDLAACGNHDYGVCIGCGRHKQKTTCAERASSTAPSLTLTSRTILSVGRHWSAPRSACFIRFINWVCRWRMVGRPADRACCSTFWMTRAPNLRPIQTLSSPQALLRV